MAVTRTPDTAHETNYSGVAFMGKAQVEVGTLAFDTQYASLGESLTFTFTPDIVVFDNHLGYQIGYDYTNSKVRVFNCNFADTDEGQFSEISENTDLSTALASVKYMALKIG